MKRILAIAMLAASLTGVASAQTSTNSNRFLIVPISAVGTNEDGTLTITHKVEGSLVEITQPESLVGISTNDPSKDDSGQWGKEITLGGSGVTDTHGNTQFGLAFSFSIQPLKIPVWFEISQELSWEPTFAGATDLDASYAINVWKEKLYIEPGWAGGWVYDQSSYYTRTGPELITQYYLTDSTFIFGQLNYDACVTGAGQKGLREAFGIGFSF